MKVTFRILSGGGGMVQGMTNGELFRMLGEWQRSYGDCFTVTREGYYRTLEFNTKENFNLFVRTFRPLREHWWKNAKIEERS
jgi:hypothetical protein